MKVRTYDLRDALIVNTPPEMAAALETFLQECIKSGQGTELRKRDDVIIRKIACGQQSIETIHAVQYELFGVQNDRAAEALCRKIFELKLVPEGKEWQILWPMDFSDLPYSEVVPT